MRESAARAARVTGVFAGACLSEYGAMASICGRWLLLRAGAMSIIASPLSYFLDLRGPSVAVDNTACLRRACYSDPPGLPEPSDPGSSPGNRSRRVNLLLSPAVFSFDRRRSCLSISVSAVRSRPPTGLFAARVPG